MGTSPPTPLDGHVARLVGELGAAAREAFEERAGVIEFDGGLNREEAERRALIDVLAQFGLARSLGLCLLRARCAGPRVWLLATDEAVARQRLAALGAVDVEACALRATLAQAFGGSAFLALRPPAPATRR